MVDSAQADTFLFGLSVASPSLEIRNSTWLLSTASSPELAEGSHSTLSSQPKGSQPKGSSELRFAGYKNRLSVASSIFNPPQANSMFDVQGLAAEEAQAA